MVYHSPVARFQDLEG